MTSSITPKQLAQIWRQHGELDLIDVRTPVEFRELHLAAARNVPLDQLRPAEVAGARRQAADAPLYVVCKSGSRARTACERLHRAGVANVVHVEGGTEACNRAGLPMVRGRQAISLERQVRIAAGVLVLTGVSLGWLVHPALVLVSGFVGAGLVFAGVTDTCGMGLLLARAPWNRCSPPETGPASRYAESQDAAA